MKKIIYFDNASTTKTNKEVIKAMMPYFHEDYGNPSSIHKMGQIVKDVVIKSKNVIAKTLNVNANEIFFTSGGSESNNWVLKSVLDINKKHKHIITTKIEHPSVINTCKYLESKGCKVDYLSVNKNGFVDKDQLKKLIKKDTVLISIIFANNEIGVIQNIKELSEIAHKNNILFHTDAVQAYSHIKIDLKKLKYVDFLSASGHKFNGPKGIGFLYIRKGVKINSLIYGGEQENGKRAGTENVTGIVGIAKAAQMFDKNSDKIIKYVLNLRNYFINRVKKEIKYVKLNGPVLKRLPNNINFSFRFVESETILMDLNKNDICASSGSACASNSLESSHVLLSIGLSHSLANSAIRFSLNYDNTVEEIDKCINVLKKIIKKRRELSPLYEDFIKNKLMRKK